MELRPKDLQLFKNETVSVVDIYFNLAPFDLGRRGRVTQHTPRFHLHDDDINVSFLELYLFLVYALPTAEEE